MKPNLPGLACHMEEDDRPDPRAEPPHPLSLSQLLKKEAP